MNLFYAASSLEMFQQGPSPSPLKVILTLILRAKFICLDLFFYFEGLYLSTFFNINCYKTEFVVNAIACRKN
jgi:hypothetical protein